jgi:hypothetical protein
MHVRRSFGAARSDPFFYSGATDAGGAAASSTPAAVASSEAAATKEPVAAAADTGGSSMEVGVFSGKPSSRVAHSALCWGRRTILRVAIALRFTDFPFQILCRYILFAMFGWTG